MICKQCHKNFIPIDGKLVTACSRKCSLAFFKKNGKANHQKIISRLINDGLIEVGKRGQLRECTKCKREYPADKNNFYQRVRGKFRLDNWCKECRNAYTENYRKTNGYKMPSNLLRKIDPQRRISHSMSREIQKALRGTKSGRRWEEIVGYDRNQLKHHLESKFLSGMNWDNYGKGGWEVDHIIPKSLFNYKDAEDADFKRCWALNNLQPMWASDNRSKHNRIKVPFQPSLAFSAKDSSSLSVPVADHTETDFYVGSQTT